MVACSQSSTPFAIAARRGVWVEIVTLLVPGFNDSEEEVTQLTEIRRIGLARHSLARDGVSSGLPDAGPDGDDGGPVAGGGHGTRAGLRYVYAGNLPGQVGDLEDTRCASCRKCFVERYGYHIRDIT